MSTDPAHSLADAFQMKSFDNKPTRIFAEERPVGLYGMEINPQDTLKEAKEALNIDKIRQ